MVAYADVLEGIVHEPTQSSECAFDLTAAAVYEVSEPGRVDFGGGELTEADLSLHPTTKRNPDDEYSWWHLEAGQYLLEYNESLAGDAVVHLQPRIALLERGASHPSLRLHHLPRVPLSVGGAGLQLKENARVSTLTDVTQL